MSKKNEEPIEIFTITKKKFDKLTPAQKRMAVVQDVIDRIKLKQLKPNGGSFIEKLKVDKNLKTQKQVSELLKSPNTTCEVCAKGGLFMAFVGIVNSYEIKGVSTSISPYRLESDEMKKLAKIFSRGQLSMIETAFEGSTYGWNEPLVDKDISKCMSFNHDYEHYTERLLAICENIIKNKGTFKP